MDAMIKLPEEEYIHKIQDGKQVTYCTLRQLCLHTIGLRLNGMSNHGRLYTRHGKRYFRPYRNYFGGKEECFAPLVNAGYMDVTPGGVKDDPDSVFYHFTRKGLDWLGDQLGIYIYDCE